MAVPLFDTRTPLIGLRDQLDAAIAVVKTWPLLDLPGVSLEIRPIVVY